MFSNDEIEQRLSELNEAWHATAAVAYNHTIDEMERAIARLDAAQNWFKERNIRLDYDGSSGNHSLSVEQPKWRHPSSHLFGSDTSYLNQLQRMRRRRLL